MNKLTRRHVEVEAHTGASACHHSNVTVHNILRATESEIVHEASNEWRL